MPILKGPQIRDYTDSHGNTIVGIPKARPNASIEFKGKSCTVTFAENVTLQGHIVFHRDNSDVTFGRWAWFDGRMTLGLGCAITMGDAFYSGWDCQMTTAEGASITFGDDVLIANACRIRADDSHPIYDGRTGHRINPSLPVTVGNHVWIGQEVFVMPGANIGSGSMIGARSVVTKSKPIPNHSLAVGSPATIIREDINWVRKHLQAHEIPESVDPIFVDA